jgi:hypothetical protein
LVLDESVAHGLPAPMKTHIIRVPDSAVVVDGLLWSYQFNIGKESRKLLDGKVTVLRPADVKLQEAYAAELKFPAEQRTHLMPTGDVTLIPDKEELRLFLNHLAHSGRSVSNSIFSPVLGCKNESCHE